MVQRLQPVQTADAAKGRSWGSLGIQEGLRWAAWGCEHWKIRNAESQLGEANNAFLSGDLSDRQTARGGEETAHSSPRTHITGLWSYVIHLSSQTVLPPFPPQPLLSSPVPLIFREVSSKLAGSLDSSSIWLALAADFSQRISGSTETDTPQKPAGYWRVHAASAAREGPAL